LAFSFYGALITLGVTFGANIVFRSGGGTGIQFGQGVTQIVNCAGTTNITLTPYAGFQNESGGGYYGLDSLVLEDIHQDCVGDDFIIKVWNNTSNTPLVITDSTTAGANETFTATRFWWSDSVTVRVMGNQFTDVELMNDTSTSTDFTTNRTAFWVSFDADPNNKNLANTKDVYKITLETAPHTGASS
jgi:hypothetical protein